MGHLVLLGRSFRVFLSIRSSRGSRGRAGLPLPGVPPVLRASSASTGKGFGSPMSRRNHDFGLDGLSRGQFGMDVGVHPRLPRSAWETSDLPLPTAIFRAPAHGPSGPSGGSSGNGWTYGPDGGPSGSGFPGMWPVATEHRSYGRNHARAGEAGAAGLQGPLRAGSFIEGYDVVHLLGHSHVPERSDGGGGGQSLPLRSTPGRGRPTVSYLSSRPRGPFRTCPVPQEQKKKWNSAVVRT